MGGDLRGFYAEPNTPTGDLSYGKMERRAPLNRLYSLSTKRLPRESTPALVVLYLKLMNFADSFLASDSAIPYVLARGEVKPRFISLQHVFLCKRNLVAVTKALDTLEMLITKIKEWKFTRKAHSNVLRLILVWWVKTMRHKYLQSKLKRAMFNLVGVMLNKKIVFREAGRKGRAAQIFGAPRGKLVRNIQTPSFLALPPRHTAGRLGPQKIRLKIKLGRSKRSDEMPRAATSKVRKLKKRETVYGYLVSRQKSLRRKFGAPVRLFTFKTKKKKIDGREERFGRV